MPLEDPLPLRPRGEWLRDAAEEEVETHLVSSTPTPHEVRAS